MTDAQRQELLEKLLAMIPPPPPERYYRLDAGGYLNAVGIGLDGEEIDGETYAAIREVIAGRPSPPAGYDYRLTSALAWELYELPAPEEDEDLDPAEALELICGSSRLTRAQALGYRTDIRTAAQAREGVIAEKPAGRAGAER